MHDPLHEFDRTQWHHNLTDPETAYRRWLLQQQWEREYKRDADSQKLIKLMNQIKALEQNEVET